MRHPSGERGSYAAGMTAKQLRESARLTILREYGRAGLLLVLKRHRTRQGRYPNLSLLLKREHVCLDSDAEITKGLGVQLWQRHLNRIPAARKQTYGDVLLPFLQRL